MRLLAYCLMLAVVAEALVFIAGLQWFFNKPFAEQFYVTINPVGWLVLVVRDGLALTVAVCLLRSSTARRQLAREDE